MEALLEGLIWNAVEASLLALAVAAVVRHVRLSPPARHALWLIVLLRLLVPPIGIHSFGLGACCSKVFQSASSYARQYTSFATLPFVAHEAPGRAQQSLAGSMPNSSGDEQVGRLPDDSVDGPRDDIALVSTFRVGTAPVDAPRLSSESLDFSDGRIDELPSSGYDHKTDRWLVRYHAGTWDRWYEFLTCQVRWEHLVLVAWLAGSLGLFLIRIKQGLRVLHVIKNAMPVSLELQALGRELAQRLGVHRMPPIRIVHGTISPTVCTLGRSVIILPKRLVDECGVELIRTVLAHELAHLKRRDHWVCWIELISSLIYWWHPVFWLVRRQIRRSADEAADACAVHVVGGRQQYAESLLQTVEVLVADRTVAAAWGPALGERDTIARRLTMIMKGPLQSRLSWPGWLGIAAIGLVVLPAAPRSLSAQDNQPVSAPAVAPPTEEEFRAVVELLSEDSPSAIEPQGGRGPLQPQAPGGPVPPQPPGAPDQPGGRDRRDPERRLGELEQKVDQILQMLQAMQAGRPGGAAGGPGMAGPGGGMMMQGMPGMPGAPGAPPMGGMPGTPGAPPMMGGMPGTGPGPGAGAMGGMRGMSPFGGRFGGPGAGAPAGQPPGGTGFGVQAPMQGGFGGGFPRTPGAAAPESEPGAQPPPARALRQRGLGGVGDPFRGVDLSPEQRDRLATMQREIEAEMQRIEAEQARVIAEFQRRRAELEKRMSDMMREFATPEQRERLERGRQDGDRGRDTEPRRRSDGDRPRDGGGDRRGPDRPREGADRRPGSDGSADGREATPE